MAYSAGWHAILRLFVPPFVLISPRSKALFQISAVAKQVFSADIIITYKLDIDGK